MRLLDLALLLAVALGERPFGPPKRHLSCRERDLSSLEKSCSAPRCSCNNAPWPGGRRRGGAVDRRLHVQRANFPCR